MPDLSLRPHSARNLPILAAVTAAALIGAGSLHADKQWTNATGDNLWSTDGNWQDLADPEGSGVPAGENAWVNGSPDEARINFAAPTIAEALIGQGAGSGTVRMQTGGSITTSHLNMAYGGGTNGTWHHDDGTLDMGAAELRLGRDDGGIATFNLNGGTVNTGNVHAVSHGGAGVTGIFNMSGGTLNSSHLRVLGLNTTSYGTGELNVSGGTINSTGGLILGRYTGTEASSATANVSGGTINLNTGNAGGNDIWVNNISGGVTTDSALNISGGSVIAPSTSNLKIGRGSNVTGSTEVNLLGTGSLDVGGNVRMNLDDSGGTAASSLTLSDDASLTAGGYLWAGHLGGDANVEVSGGTLTVNGETKLGNANASSTATGNLTVTGGTVALNNLVGVGSDSSGRGHVSIGGDAVFSFGGAGSSMVLRSGDNTFTVNGSAATINGTRLTGTSLEFNDGNVVSFNFDAAGISAVNLIADIRFGGSDVTLNVDTNGIANGVYLLFDFGGYHNPDGTWATTFGTENISGLLAGQSANVLYNSDSIQLEVIPEPGTYAAIFGALALLGVMLRRRVRK